MSALRGIDSTFTTDVGLDGAGCAVAVNLFGGNRRSLSHEWSVSMGRFISSGDLIKSRAAGCRRFRTGWSMPVLSSTLMTSVLPSMGISSDHRWLLVDLIAKS